MANSADPDQLASSEAKKPPDLDLHFFQRQGISWFSRTRVNMDEARPDNLEDILAIREK